MTPERWQQIKHLCALALDHEPDARAGFVNEACAGDVALQADVDELLRHATVETAGVDVPGWPRLALGSPLLPADGVSPLPDRIGRYRVVRLLGEGGMGTVYEAEQDAPKRRVAVKVVRAGHAGRDMRRRLERESQALGRLQHPGIAQVYEAGTAEMGAAMQPYFAMEFIQGRPIEEYVSSNAVALPGRLELVAKICDAVQHAHDRGIVHRDIKPGNILVDAAGQPKVLDFGVARLLETPATDTLHTSEGQMVGTLAYMSPEQVLGDPTAIDGRSDVYAIGVVLYELLAGRMPYEVGGRPDQAAEAILEEDPDPLGTVDRRFRGDIETIVAKALDKDRVRRYESAAALAADLRRYISNEPITARPASAAYQLHKFVRRHRSLVVAVAAVIVTLTAGTAVSSWQALRARASQRAAEDAEGRARRERDDAVRDRNRALTAEQAAEHERGRALLAQDTAQAERGKALDAGRRAMTEAAIARAVQDFLQSDLLAQSSAQQQTLVDSKPDPDLKVRTALDRAAARVAGRFRDQPLVEASVRQTIGSAYEDLGLYDKAREQLQRALQIRRSAGGAGDAATLESLQQLAQTTMQLGAFPEAERLYLEAIGGLRRRHGENGAPVLQAQAGLVDVYLQEGRYREAEALIAATLETQRRELGADHPSTRTSLSELGRAQIAQGKYVEAERTLRTLLAAVERAKGPNHPDTLTAQTDLAETLERQLKYEEAERLYTATLESERRTLGADHPYTLTTANNLAVMFKTEGKYGQAEPLYATVVAGRTGSLGAEHPDTLSAMNNLGALYVSEKRYADAEALLARVLAARRRVLGAEHPNTLNTMVNLAQAYRGVGRVADTETLYADVLSIRQRVLGQEHPDTIFIMSNLGVLYVSQARFDEAERLLSTVRDVRRRTLGDQHPSTAQASDNLGGVYLARGDVLRAQQLFAEALEHRRRALGPDHADTLRSEANLAAAYLDGGDGRGAAMLEATLTHSRTALGAAHDVTLMIQERMAMLRRRQGRFAEAAALLTEAIDVRRRLLGPRHSYTVEDVVKLALLQLDQRDYARAEATVRPLASADAPSDSPWLTAEAHSVLGAALAGLGRLEEAERELLAAHSGLVALGTRIPVQETSMIALTVDRLVDLYRALGNDERAAFWAKRQAPR